MLIWDGRHQARAEPYVTKLRERICVWWRSLMALRGVVPHRDFGSLRRLMPSERNRAQEAVAVGGLKEPRHLHT